MRKGFSLAELIVGLFVLGSLTAAVFVIFNLGISSYQVGGSRLDLQSDLRRILSPLRRDLRNSTFQSVGIVAPPATPKRQALCFSGLTDLAPGTTYDPVTGQPRWNCYVLYFVVTGPEPTGRMVRATVKDPAPDDVITVPLANLSSYLTYPNVKDLLGNDLRSLSRQVLEFEAETRAADQLVSFRLHLRAPKVRALQGRKEVQENLEIRLSVRPANTWPRL